MIEFKIISARANRKGKREYLNDSLTRNLMKSLNEYFKTKVEIPRIRMGKSQEIETLINEEAYLFAMYLRAEKSSWIPRVARLKRVFERNENEDLQKKQMWAE